MIHLRSLFIPLILILTSCSGAPEVEIPEDIAAMENVEVYSNDVEPTQNLVFSDSLIINDDSGILFSGRISAKENEADDIFVTDYTQRRIFQFNEVGEFIREYGGEGSGPGEFTGIQYPAVRNGILAAYDWGPRRLNLYDTNTGELIRDFVVVYEEQAEEGEWLMNGFRMMEDGNLLARMTRAVRPESADPKMDNRLMLISPEGTFLDDSLLQLEEPPAINIGGVFTARPQFMSQLIIRIGDNGLYYGTTDRLLIHVAGLSGEYRDAFYYDLIGDPVTQSDIDASAEGLPPQFGQLMAQADLPERWPVWNTIFVDDQSRLWISLRNSDEESELTTWWVLDSNGQKLAEKQLPSHMDISDIGDNHLYVSSLDENGSRVIKRYTFELE
jgi:hypothetical protein